MRQGRRGSIAVELVVLTGLVALWLGLRFDLPGVLLTAGPSSGHGAVIAAGPAVR